MNVAALDQRHQELFDMVSELEQALRAGEGNAAVDRILDRPDTQVGMHFTFEESLMADHDKEEQTSHDCRSAPKRPESGRSLL